MNHNAPPHRTLRVVLLSLTILCVASALIVIRRPLLMAGPACMSGQLQGCLGTENGVILMMLVTLPLSALLVWALASYRRATGVPSPWRKSIAEVGMVHGTLPFLWITLMPGPGAGIVPGRLSLIPLHDLATMGPIGVGGNLLVFAALGFFAPLRFAALASLPRMLALGAACSILVETSQYVFQLDRVSSVDDVLVNTTGVVLAALASRHWWRAASRDEPAPVLAPVG